MSKKTIHGNSLEGKLGPEKISIQEEAGEKLRESEQLFRSLTEKSFAAAFIVQDGSFRYINTSAVAYAGYSAEELIGHNSDIIVHSDDKGMVKEKAREMLQGKDSTPYEFRMVTKQGKIRSIIQIVSSIQYNGKPAILGNAIDITERKQAEGALRESERRLADIIDFLPDATLAIDLQGKVIAWNRAIEEMTGVKASDILGKGDYEYALPFYGIRRPILIDLVFGYDEEIEKKYRFIKKEGNVLLTEADVPLRGGSSVLWAKATPLYDSKGNVVGAIESIRDITERKQLEELLRMSEEKYRQLFATVPDAIFIFDVDSRQFVDANESALKLYGYTREEFLKLKYADITAEPEESEKSIEEILIKKAKMILLRYHVKKDKTVFPVEMAASMYDLGERKVICLVIRDNTDRRLVEKVLKESEERYRTLFESTANPILVIDTEGNYMSCNNAALQFLQCSQDELLLKNVRDFLPPDRSNEILEIHESLWKSGGSAEIEYFIDGKIKFMELTITPTTWQGKHVILGIGKDITKRKQAEEALRESERRLADIIDFLPDATLAIDLEGKVIAWNHAIEEMTGVKASDMLGKGEYEYALPFYGIRRPILLDQVLRPDKKIEQSYYSILEKQMDLLIVETWVPCLKGERAFLWAKATPLYDSKGDVVGAIESIRDITERMQAEKMIQESEEKYRSLASTVDLMYLVDRNCRYLFMNNGHLSRFGIPLDKMEGRFYDEFHSEEDAREFTEIVKRIFKTCQSVQHEHKSGRDGRYFLRTLSPVKDSEGKTSAVTVVSKDITLRKQAEEALRESERRLADIIDFLPDATLAIDLEGKVIAWNHAIEEMTGVKASDMLGKGEYEYALPFYGIRRPILLDQVLKPDKKVEQSYYSILKKDKDVLIVETWVPFLKWKKAFLWAKATPLYNSRGDVVGAIESIRDITERKQAEEAIENREKELEVKTRELEDLNAALRVLLKQREEDRSELEQKVLSNVKVLILPHMDKLKNHVDMKGISYVNVLESNLKDIISPFAQKLSVKYLNLTNREVQIANLIKEGKTTKEIASFLNVSDSAVNVYRYHIRHKLSLAKKHNLRSYLSSLV